MVVLAPEPKCAQPPQKRGEHLIPSPPPQSLLLGGCVCVWGGAEMPCASPQIGTKLHAPKPHQLPLSSAPLAPDFWGAMGPRHGQEAPCPSPWLRTGVVGGDVCLVGWGWARWAPTWLCLRPGRPPVLAHIAAPWCPCPAKPITRWLCGSPLSPAPLLPGHGAWHGPPRVGGSKLQPPPSPHQGSICPQSPWGRQPLIPQPLEPQPPGSAVGGGLLAVPPPQHHTPDPPIS